MLGVGCWVLGVGCWVLGVGCWDRQFGSQHPIPNAQYLNGFRIDALKNRLGAAVDAVGIDDGDAVGTEAGAHGGGFALALVLEVAVADEARGVYDRDGDTSGRGSRE